MAYGSVNVPGDLSGKQDLITGVPGQLVGFDLTGTATPLTLTPSPNVELKQEGSTLEIGAVVPGKNLLDNWYFVGGGSQSGSDKFPINQRGQTEYAGAGYTIDRWIVSAGNGNVVLHDDYVSFGGSNGTYIQYRSDLKIDGKMLTFSIFTSDDKCYSSTGLASPNNWGVASMPIGGLNFYLACTGLGTLYIQAYVSNGNSPAKIKAMKVELGSVQTLAHKEGDTWVLNDPPPDKALELAKCQRYYRTVNSICFGYALDAEQMESSLVYPVVLMLTIPVDMRIKNPVFVPSYVAAFMPNGWDTTFMSNVSVTYNSNVARIKAILAGGQIPGTRGGGHVRGAWDANL